MSNILTHDPIRPVSGKRLAGEFESLHLLGPARRPQYLISRTEVERIKATRRFQGEA